MPPAYIMPQDGEAHQDCAQSAGKRWLRKQAQAVAPHQVTLRGEDLYSTQPFCLLALQQGYNFILPCKPDSHATLSERWAFWQTTDRLATREQHQWNGRCTEVLRYRYINDVLLRGGDAAFAVNWCAITVVNATTGEPLYHNSFITNHRLSADNIADVAQAGRGRWKIENDNNHVLKTQGYHLEHNFGPGPHYLAAFLRSLNLLALLCHTVWEWSDDQDALLRRVLVRRQTLFEDIRALLRDMVFDSWQHLMDCMIPGLELQPPGDTGEPPN